MTLAITGGQLIDGLGGDPIRNGVVVVDDGRIVTAGPVGSVPKPAGARILDTNGATILPGIIDCHVHSTYRARDLKQHLLNTPSYNILRSTWILRETLACGVTTARDMGGADTGFREAIADGTIEGPRLLVAVLMITQTGGHGDNWVSAGFRMPKRAWLPSAVADGPAEVRRLVRRTLMMGADFIKLCSSGGITSFTDSWDEPQFSVDEIRAAVREAAAKRKTVAVHAEGIAGIRLALEAGCHSLEHGWFIDEECVDRMLRQGTWWVPTLALVPRSVARREADPTWSDQQLAAEDAKEAQIYARLKSQIPLWRDAVRRGVKIAMGTDQSHRLLVGENLVELEYLVEWLGMTPLDAIVSATSRAAACIGRPDLGALEPGRIADLLVVEGDPLTDIRVLQRRQQLLLVMKDGVPYRNQLN